MTGACCDTTAPLTGKEIQFSSRPDKASRSKQAPGKKINRRIFFLSPPSASLDTYRGGGALFGGGVEKIASHRSGFFGSGLRAQLTFPRSNCDDLRPVNLLSREAGEFMTRRKMEEGCHSIRRNRKSRG